MFASILLPLDGDDHSKNIFRVALNFARSFDAHLSVLHIQSDAKDIVPLLGEGMSVAMIEDMIELAERESNKRYKKAKKIFDDAVSKNEVNIAEAPAAGGVSARWILEKGREDEFIRRYSRVVDITFVALPSKSNDVSKNQRIHTLLFESGRGVLVLPPHFNFQLGGKVVISWNGSVQSSRAVRAALPILSMAKNVHIFAINTSSESQIQNSGLQDYLGWHGINSEETHITGAPNSVGPKVHEKVQSLNADLLVMGAYTQSRMRQLILGGVTRYIIENADYSVFMAH